MPRGGRQKTQEEIIEQTAAYAARKIEQKRRGIRVTSSAEMSCTASQAEVIEMVQKAYILFERPTVNTEEQVCDAFNWYFTEYLPKTGAFPTVEGLAAACGISTRTLNDWEKLNDTRSLMVQKAKQVLAELDAQLVQSGKIPQVIYIFRSKNFHHMRDAVEVEHISMRSDTESPDQLAARYADAIPVDFVDAEGAENGQNGS